VTATSLHTEKPSFHLTTLHIKNRVRQVISANADGPRDADSRLATISRCNPWQSWMSSVFTRQQHLFILLILTALCYTDQLRHKLPVGVGQSHGKYLTTLLHSFNGLFPGQPG